MLLSSPRQLFVRQYGRGVGKYYTTIYGGGRRNFFTNTLKTLGRLALAGTRKLYRIAKPKALSFAKEAISELKPKVQQSLADASVKAIDNLLNKPSALKQTAKESIHDIKEAISSSVPQITESATKTLHEILHGTGTKRKHPSKDSRRVLSKLLRKAHQLTTKKARYNTRSNNGLLEHN